jgi:hypothetical protein
MDVHPVFLRGVVALLAMLTHYVMVYAWKTLWVQVTVLFVSLDLLVLLHLLRLSLGRLTQMRLLRFTRVPMPLVLVPQIVTVLFVVIAQSDW